MKVFRLAPILLLATSLAGPKPRLSFLLQQTVQPLTVTYDLIEYESYDVSKPLQEFANFERPVPREARHLLITFCQSKRGLLFLARDGDKVISAMTYNGFSTDFFDGVHPRLFHMKGALLWLNPYFPILPLNSPVLAFFKPAPKIDRYLPTAISGVGMLLPESNTVERSNPAYVAAFVHDSGTGTEQCLTVHADSDSQPSRVLTFASWRSLADVQVPATIVSARNGAEIRDGKVRVSKYLVQKFSLKSAEVESVSAESYDVMGYAKAGDPLQDEGLATSFDPKGGSFNDQLERERRRIVKNSREPRVRTARSDVPDIVLAVGVAVILGGAVAWSLGRRHTLAR